MNKGVAPCWHAYRCNMSTDKIEVFNVFDHSGFLNDCIKAAKKYRNDEVAFADEVRRNLFYYFCTKYEWEVEISGLSERDESAKVDVYQQVMMNWDHFVGYCQTLFLKNKNNPTENPAKTISPTPLPIK